MKEIAILTSGGDSPGLNACIRAIVRASAYYKMKVVGIKGGFEGMIEGDFVPMNASSVSNIIHLGGTILKSSRSERFKTKEGRKIAHEQLKKRGIDTLILIGGDGSCKGGGIFSQEYPDISIIAIPKTIDNDVFGTDYSIGHDTAVNTAMQAVDKIRDTAESHNRVFIIEVMGRDAGYIAYGAGIATGAEGILIPETTADLKYLKKSFENGWSRDKSSLIIIVAEGDESGGGMQAAEKLKKMMPEKEIKVSVLGYIQRGGSPTSFDRILAARFGVAAIELLLKGKKNIMVGMHKDAIITTPISKVKRKSMDVNEEALTFLKILTS